MRKITWTKGTRTLEKGNRVILVNLWEHTWVKLKKEALSLLEKAIKFGTEETLSVMNKEERQEFRKLIISLKKKGYVTFDLGEVEEERVLTNEDWEWLPKTAYYEVSEKCNLSCKFCYSNSPYAAKPYKGNLVLERKILKKLSDINVLSLILSGGEPLLNEDVFEIVKIAKDMIPNVAITTNGTLIGIEEAKKLRDAGVDVIQLSVESPKERIHDYLRGEGTFKKTMTAIDNLKKAGFEGEKLIITATIMKHNIESLKDFTSFAEDIGVKSSYSLFQSSGRGKYTANKFAVSCGSLLSFYFNLLKESGGFPEDSEKHFNLANDLIAKEIVPKVQNDCGIGKLTIAVKEKGNLVPCHLFLSSDDFILGNILEEGTVEKAVNFVNSLPSIDEVEGCKDCDIRYFCANGCLGSVYFRHNNFNGRNPYCEFYKKYKSSIIWNLGEENETERIYESFRKNIDSCLPDS